MENINKKKQKEEKLKSDVFSKEKKDIRIKIDTKNLLEELAWKISKEFWIDITQVKDLINSKTEAKLDNLMLDIWNKENLLNVILWAREVIQKASKEEIDLLKGKIDKLAYNPENNIYVSNKFIWDRFFDKAKNPKNIGDNIIWASIWIINSTEDLIKVLYNIWAWVIKTPYHIYMIVKWKAKYENFKKI